MQSEADTYRDLEMWSRGLRTPGVFGDLCPCIKKGENIIYLVALETVSDKPLT